MVFWDVHTMKSQIFNTFVFFTVFMAFGQPAFLSARPLELVSAKMADSSAEKLLLNITGHIARQIDPPLKVSQKPLGRTYYELENFPGYCSLAIIRSNATEHKFQWVVPSFVTEFSIVKRKNDPTIFDTQNSIIAVAKGSIMEKKLEKAALNATALRSRQKIVDQLVKEKIHFWGDADAIIQNIENQTDGLAFVRVKALPSIDLWVACNKRSNADAVHALKTEWLKEIKSPKFKKYYDQLFQLFLR